MCSVCGCGDAKVEGQSHAHSHDHHHDHHHGEHDHHHDHHHGEHAHHQSKAEQPVVVHHHYHHQGDVHHHYHYHIEPGQHGHGHLTSSDHQAHHHAHSEEAHEPERDQNGDLHYGHGEAGTHVPGMNQRRLVEIEMDVLDKNNHLAAHNREHFISDEQLVLNLVSSPGSGKTTLLTETLKHLQQHRSCAVIEGDQQTANDADRIRETGVPAVQVNTGKGCHLDAKMVHDACHQLNLEKGGVLFIENVGNLVCPASFDLGEKYKVAILSVTEGEDKPLKYPNMFAAAELMIINKIDLLPYVAFDMDTCIENARRVNPDIKVINLSATTHEGMDAWYSWLESASCV